MRISRLGASLRRLTLIGGCALALGGCYTLQPVSEPPDPGADVRLHLSGDGAVRIGQMTGALREQLEGELVEADSDTIKIAVRRYRRQDAFDTRRELVQTLAVARSEVSLIQERQLSRGRSFLLIGGAAAAGAIIAASVSSSGGSSGPGPGNGEGPPTTLVRIPVGIFFR